MTAYERQSRSTATGRSPQSAQSAQSTQSHHYHTPDQPSHRRAASRRARMVNLGDVLKHLAYISVLVVTFPVQVIQFLTRPPGSAILLGMGALYFSLLNIEGYWQSLGTGLGSAVKPSFLPKLFIADGADLWNLLPAVFDGSFWIAVVVSLIVQGIQAFVLRERDIEQVRAEYERVARYQVPDARERGLDIAEVRRLEFKRAGMRTLRTRGFAILVTYLADLLIATWNFPLLGLTLQQFLIHLFWLTASVFGAELMINLFLGAIAQSPRRSEVVS